MKEPIDYVGGFFFVQAVTKLGRFQIVRDRLLIPPTSPKRVKQLRFRPYSVIKTGTRPRTADTCFINTIFWNLNELFYTLSK